MTDLNSCKERLPEYLERYHNINPKKLFNCLNPNHEDKHPSMSYFSKKNICKCFSCGVCYDIFDLIKVDYGCNEFKEQLNKYSELFNENINIYSPKYSDYSVNFDEEKIDYENYFIECRSQINKTNYLEKRGIDKRLLTKYNIGYDVKNKRIIFPINKYCYFARGVEDNLKLKSKGKSYLWNENLLKDSDEKTLIYITEGIIDALTLETLNPNIKTVSLNGIPNKKRLLEIVKKNNFKGNLVLVFDKDYAGLTAQEELRKDLDKLNVCSFLLTLINGFDNNCKDVNEALLLDKDKLNKSLTYINDNLENIILKKLESKNEELSI